LKFDLLFCFVCTFIFIWWFPWASSFDFFVIAGTVASSLPFFTGENYVDAFSTILYSACLSKFLGFGMISDPD